MLPRPLKAAGIPFERQPRQIYVSNTGSLWSATEESPIMPPSEPTPAFPADLSLDGEPADGEFSRFFGHCHDVLIILDGDGRLLNLSPSAKRVLGYAMESLPKASLLRLIHHADRVMVQAKARDLQAGQPVSVLHVRVRRAEGDWLPMGWSLALGSHGQIYAVGRDETEPVRRRESHLRQEMAEFRLRTALELHDGILQTLTGAAFQIAVARRLVRSDPDQAAQVLANLAKSLGAEQQEMRLYVDEIKNPSPAWNGGGPGLRTRIDAMLDRVSVIWGVRTDAHLRFPSGLSPETERCLLRITQEAVVNAVRHGGARSISLKSGIEGREVLMELSDDGHGFSFVGEYDDAALRAQRLGPVSLKHRVAAAGGKISIVSTLRGVRLSLRIPLSREDLA